MMVVSCSTDDDVKSSDEVIKTPVEHTLFMYFPWSTDLTGFFYRNIADMEESIITQGGLDNQRVMVFISTSATEARMFEITYSNGQCRRRDIKTYDTPSLTTADGVASILSDMMTVAQPIDMP